MAKGNSSGNNHAGECQIGVGLTWVATTVYSFRYIDLWGVFMKKTGLTALALWLLMLPILTGISRSAQASDKGKETPPPALKVGDTAPDFKLQYFDGKSLKDVSLADYRGKKNVILAFYIFAFTGG
jgi:AhpC/TSA family protein